MKHEYTELTVMCMIYKEDKILLQERLKDDWRGIAFPGGHVKKGESFTHAVIREMKEETGLDIYAPHLCGIEQFYTNENIRYLILMFKTSQYSGKLCSSKEGNMLWVKRDEVRNFNLVKNFFDVLKIFDKEEINELFYSFGSNNEWLPDFY